MAYISKISIKSFRGIQNLVVDSLNNINIVLGDNNCGKTSFLEAVMFLRTSNDISNIYRISNVRDSLSLDASPSSYEKIMCMFSRDIDNRNIEITGEMNNKGISYRLFGEESKVLLNTIEVDSFSGVSELLYGSKKKTRRISLARTSHTKGVRIEDSDDFPIVYLAPFEHLKGNVVNRIVANKDYKEICLDLIKMFDPDIEDLMILKSDVGDRPVEYIRHKRLGNMPLSTYGDGIKKVLTLCNAIVKANGGILLIDEIDTAIHKKYYDNIFAFLISACLRFNIQMFVTTHSIEAIDAFLASQDYDNNSNERINVVTLKREDNKTYCRVMPGKEVYLNRERFGFEVRL